MKKNPSAPSNPVDLYPQQVAWSAVDGAFIGFCPAFFCGGVCHATNPVSALRTLRQLIAGEIERYRTEGIPLPRPGGRSGVTVKARPQASTTSARKRQALPA